MQEKDDEIRELRRENEKQKRHKNLILHKIPENEPNGRALKEIVIKMILSECKVDISNYIDSIFRLGKKTDGRTRPVLLALTSFDQKMNILWSKKQHSAKLEITEDFPKDVGDERKRLAPMLVTLRELGYKNVHLKYDKLCVDGIECTEERYNQLVDDKRKPHEISNTTLAETESLNNTIKRVRQTSMDEEDLPLHPNAENKKAKTTIIGACTTRNYGGGKNPIKEALSRQVAMQYSSSPNPK